MYVIQEGEVEVFRDEDEGEVRLAVLKERDFFGEVPLLDRSRRSASVRALGDVRVLTVDKKTFLRRIHEDPSLAYRILQTLSRRVQELNDEVTKLVLGDEAPAEGGDAD
jgi:CRP/FNR family transcriptional regulator